MRKLLSIILVIGSFASIAQNRLGNPDDLSRIAIAVYVPSYLGDGIPGVVNRQLESKLKQIVTKYGMGGSSFSQRFVITPEVVVTDKSFTASAPPMAVIELDLTVYVGDALDGTLFATEYLTLKGVGQNDNKAFSDALKKLRSNNPVFKGFIETAQEKIVSYYNGQCDFILKKAEGLAAQKKFEAAIFELMMVPEVCKECYMKAVDAVEPIFQEKIDRDCEALLSEANGVWSASLDVEAGINASKILKKMDPDAKCFGEATSLMKDIEKRVKELDDRDWDFELTGRDMDQEMEADRIDAIKEVGVAYGKNQPKKEVFLNSDAEWINAGDQD